MCVGLVHLVIVVFAVVIVVVVSYAPGGVLSFRHFVAIPVSSSICLCPVRRRRRRRHSVLNMYKFQV